MNIGRHVRAVTLSWLFVGSMDQHHAFGQAPLTTSPSQPSRALREMGNTILTSILASGGLTIVAFCIRWRAHAIG